MPTAISFLSNYMYDMSDTRISDRISKERLFYARYTTVNGVTQIRDASISGNTNAQSSSRVSGCTQALRV